MKANTMKRVLAFALSATMVFASAVTVFAADPDTTAGTGQILDYKIQTQVVPTSMKLAINPNGYAVNLRYKKLADNAEFGATTKYYTKTGNTYAVDTAVNSTNFNTKKATLYTAETSTAQIVSFNYGLANKSTVDRKITVKLDVVADNEVEFVDAVTKAQNVSASNEGGAAKGEHKIFLQLVPAKAGDSETITTNTYAVATEFDANTTYYERDAQGAYTETTIADAEAFEALEDPVYIETTTIGTEVQAKELADVTMKASTAPISFATGKGTSNADVAYSLPAAQYTLKKDAFIDFDTTTANVGGKFEMTGIGGVSGFTITGTMNTNTEWASLGTKTITVTPTYDFDDATGMETAVSTGKYQVEAAARSYTVTYHPAWKADGAEDYTIATESVNSGSHPTGSGDDIAALKTIREGYTWKGWGLADSVSAAAELTEADKLENLNGISSATTLYAIWEEASYLSKATLTASANSVNVTLPTSVTVSGIMLYQSDGTTEVAALDELVTVSGSTYTFNPEHITAWLGNSWNKIKFTFSDNKTETITLQ